MKSKQLSVFSARGDGGDITSTVFNAVFNLRFNALFSLQLSIFSLQLSIFLLKIMTATKFTPRPPRPPRPTRPTRPPQFRGGPRGRPKGKHMCNPSNQTASKPNFPPLREIVKTRYVATLHATSRGRHPCTIQENKGDRHLAPRHVQ